MPNETTKSTKELIKIIVASCLGSIFEWYDFELYGLLASNIANNFFSSLPSGSAFVMALFTFASGLALRPLGGLLFGYFGDKIGRKYSFLITISLMGVSTFCVGLLPSYQTIGIAAPILLVFLRVPILGILQASTIGGDLAGLVIVILSRLIIGTKNFEEWGWRIPFLMSVFLLALSVYMRRKMSETPLFEQMKSERKESKNPLAESFLKWKNLKIVILALFGAVAGQAAISYGSVLNVFFFMTHTLKLQALTANTLLLFIHTTNMCFLLFFGYLSDFTGRKLLVMTGCFLGAISLYPAYHGIAYLVNPDMAHAMANSPAVVVADPADCSLQLIPSEIRNHIKISSSCDLLKNVLSEYGVSYSNEEGPKGSLSKVLIGNRTIPSVDVSKMTENDSKIAQQNLSNSLIEAIHEAGYPTSANAEKVNHVLLLFLWCFLGMNMSLTYGPLAAWLVELFPTRIRYTALSLPYHIGNGWIGGFLPTIGFSMVLATGDIYAGLWYPIFVGLLAFVIGSLFLKETKDRDIANTEIDDEEYPIQKIIRKCKCKKTYSFSVNK